MIINHQSGYVSKPRLRMANKPAGRHCRNNDRRKNGNLAEDSTEYCCRT